MGATSEKCHERTPGRRLTVATTYDDGDLGLIDLTLQAGSFAADSLRHLRVADSMRLRLARSI
jgi:hypothetical protein